MFEMTKLEKQVYEEEKENWYRIVKTGNIQEIDKVIWMHPEDYAWARLKGLKLKQRGDK